MTLLNKKPKFSKNPSVVIIRGDTTRIAFVFKECAGLLFAWDTERRERVVFVKTAKPKLFLQARGKIERYTRCWFADEDSMLTIDYLSGNIDEDSVKALKDYIKEAFKGKWRKESFKEWEGSFDEQREAYALMRESVSDEEYRKLDFAKQKELDTVELRIPAVILSPVSEDEINKWDLSTTLDVYLKLILNNEAVYQAYRAIKSSMGWREAIPWIGFGAAIGTIATFFMLAVFPQILETKWF